MKTIYIPYFEKREAGERDDLSPLTWAAGLAITVALIIFFGLTMLYSTSCSIAGTRFFLKQFMWAVAGFSGATVVFFIGYRRLSEYSMMFIGICAVLLIVADFFCPAVNGAHRWIPIPGLGNIQPSEFAKLAVAIYLAKYCSEHIRSLNRISLKNGIIPAAFVCGIILLLVFKGKDWGATALLASVCALIFFAAGVRLSLLLLPAIILIPPAVYWLKYMDPERWSRLNSFMTPELFQKTDSYQLWNSLLALGSGNYFGLGLAHSRLKARYLPEAHTDFILSIVGEELGFVFMAMVIVVYICFLYFAIQISINAKTKHGMLLGFGVTSIIILQALINIGVISGALPTKGMPAPFISYGGSNLVTCLLGVGILISIAVDSVNPDLNKDILSGLKKRIFGFLPHKKN